MPGEILPRHFFFPNFSALQRSLQLEELPFPLRAWAEVPDPSRRRHHPVAGDDDRDGVCSHGLAHGPRCFGPPDPARELPIGQCGSIWNPQEFPPNRDLKRCPHGIQRDGELPAFPSEVFPELPLDLRGGSFRRREGHLNVMPGEVESEDSPLAPAHEELSPRGLDEGETPFHCPR